MQFFTLPPMIDIQPEDKKFYITKPDKNFNPDRNRKIVEETIKKYEKMRLQKHHDYIDRIRERSDAVASYFRSRMADSNNPIDKYLGRKNLAYLQGRKILQRIKNINGKQILTLEESE